MKNTYDVIVAGGGFTGVAAALAAARGGSDVLLLEETNALGGAACRALVTPFMPHFTPIHPKNGQAQKMLSAGIFAEICQHLQEMTVKTHGEHNRAARIPMWEFSEEYLKVLLNRMVTEAGVKVLFHTSVISAQEKDGEIESITVFSGSVTETLFAKTYIDCTGDADLAVLAGFPYQLGRDGDHLCQPMTLCFRLGDVDIPKFNASREHMQKAYKEWQAAGKLRNIRENVLVFHTISDTVLHFNTTRVVKYNPTDPEDVSRAEMEAREQVWEMFLFFRECVDGCQNATLLSTAMQIGVRESRMIKGEYKLTKDDLLACRKFEDGIAACNYEIDIHNPEGSGTSHYFFPDGDYYTIPYRSLIPKDAKNLLVAGRCISSDHEAQASYRIMPVVCTLGEAAGEAAALAKDSGCFARDVSTDVLRQRLRQKGAVVD